MTILNEDDKEIESSELTFKRYFLAKIVYNYAEFKNQSTILTVSVDDHEIEEPVVEEINKIKYSINVFNNTSVDELKAKITADFIKQQLSLENKKIFRDDKFKLNKIIKNGEELSDEDLKNPGIIKTGINYEYGAIRNQDTDLVISIRENESKKPNFSAIDKEMSNFYRLSDITGIFRDVDANAFFFDATKINEVDNGLFNLNHKFSEFYGLSDTTGILHHSSGNAYFFVSINLGEKFSAWYLGKQISVFYSMSVTTGIFKDVNDNAFLFDARKVNNSNRGFLNLDKQISAFYCMLGTTGIFQDKNNQAYFFEYK